MIYLISGASHVGKTLLAQKLVSQTKLFLAYMSLDTTGLIRKLINAGIG